jgi:hypothetical protein
MLAGGWEERGEGVCTSIFGVGESITTPIPYFVFLYNSLHIINNCGRTDIIYLAIEILMFLIKSIFSMSVTTYESALSHSSHAQIRTKTDIDKCPTQKRMTIDESID